MWLEWKRRIDPGHYLNPNREHARRDIDADPQLLAAGVMTEDERYGTINCNGISPDGQIGGVTTTSGLAWKIPGRVGDSPILGAELVPLEPLLEGAASDQWLRTARRPDRTPHLSVRRPPSPSKCMQIIVYKLLTGILHTTIPSLYPAF